MKPRLDFFNGGTDGDGTLETLGQPSVFTQITLTMPQSPVHGDVKCFPCDPVKEHSFHQQPLASQPGEGGDMAHGCMPMTSFT